MKYKRFFKRSAFFIPHIIILIFNKKVYDFVLFIINKFEYGALVLFFIFFFGFIFSLVLWWKWLAYTENE